LTEAAQPESFPELGPHMFYIGQPLTGLP